MTSTGAAPMSRDMGDVVIRPYPSMAQKLGAICALGGAMGWGRFGGGIQWRGVRGYMAKYRQRRRVRNRMAALSRRKNRGSRR